MSLDFSVIIFRDGDFWIAQGLEYDLCAQARSIDDIHAAFVREVAANAAITIDRGTEPLEGIPPAPRTFWDMWEPEEVPLRVPHNALMPPIRPRYRVLEHHRAAVA